MSANEETKTGCCGESDEVRRAFAALPFEQRLSTLLCVQADMVVDAVESVAAATSRALDDFANFFIGPDDEPVPAAPSPDHPTA